MDEAIKTINELLITQDEINKKNELAIKILQDKVAELEVRQDKVRVRIEGDTNYKRY
jgi:hypothetical protein